MHVELTRGPAVESRHRLDVVVARPDQPVVVWGSAEVPVIPRSAIKFVQALPLLTSGAAERFDLDDRELALACSSHSAEAAHVDAVAAWLARIGCSAHDLECGPDLPLGPDALIEHHRSGADPQPINNCCSGKHAGFLTVARHLGLETEGYIEPDHPVQQLVTSSIEELTGQGLVDQTPGRDGCGIPTFALPLGRLASAMARLVSPETLAADTAAAASRLIGVPDGRQFWISGSERMEVRLGQAIDEPLLAKVGAEGVFVIGLPERGLGVAIKAADGANRACEVGVAAVLAWLGVLPGDRAEGLAERQLINKAGVPVGNISVVVEPPVLNTL